jgi:hypothetical protein
MSARPFDGEDAVVSAAPREKMTVKMTRVHLCPIMAVGIQ